MPREDGSFREYQAMHEESFLSSWLRDDVERKDGEKKKLNEEAEREEIKIGKREVERENERVDIKRMCLDRVSSDVFEDFSPISDVESVGDSFWVSSVCPCCASVCGCCGCSFLECDCVRSSSLIRIVNLLNRRPFLSPENAKQGVVLENEAETTIGSRRFELSMDCARTSAHRQDGAISGEK